jgi:alpha-ketoglutarate-dependent taurine dioxygenase
MGKTGRKERAPSLAAAGERSHAIAIDRVSPALGAEIGGVDLASAAEDDARIVEIRALLLQHKVLFFRDQDITPGQHVAFARRFGELEVHPVYPHHPDHPELVLLDRDTAKAARENIFHTDVSWRETPSLGSILRCVECPAMGGDTIWVDMVAAYEALPQRVKERIGGLLAMHDIAHAFGGKVPRDERAALARRYPPQEHPVVRTHPETGAKILYVNQAFTTHFSNYTAAGELRVGSDFALEANALMAYLMQQAAIPEYQVRLRWRPNTIAFWDNRATQHYAVADYHPAVRRMMRATIIGDRPR